jgi:hypothetical protein
MKKWVSLTALLLVAGFAFFSAGCIDGDTPPVTNLNYDIVNDADDNPGGGIKVTWSAPADATPDEYIVSVDGIDQVAVDVTEDYVYTAGAEVAVYAVYNDVKSAKETLDFGAEETISIDVWPVTDPDPEHPSAFGFGENGMAATYAVSDKSNWPSIDFYIAADLYLTAPADHLPDAINNEANASSAETGTYDALGIVAATGQQLYLTGRKLTDNGLFGLWIDPTADGYDEGDHFGKAVVTGIDGDKVTLKVAYQKVAGIRWVVVD